MTVTAAQVRKLMAELGKHGQIGRAALRAGMDRKTARKYRRLGGPLKGPTPRSWRTREDPFEEDWAYVRGLLQDAPELEAKALFEHLLERNEGRYHEGQLRTLQRRLKRWRAQEGPAREVYFAQAHRPGEAGQTDFTSGNQLGVTIQGEPFDHLLCHFVLPYSNWQWVTVCRSESLVALRRGLQAGVFQLRHVPQFHQTDNSTAATHAARSEEGRFVPWEDPEGKRSSKRLFNERYLDLMRHLGMTPRTIAIGQSHQNGDVESLNGALKRRLKQHLTLRGDRDFESVAAYEVWVQEVLTKANRGRTKKVQEELAAMRPLTVEPLPEFSVDRARVTLWSTVRVRHNTYSVPSRLQGEEVEVRVYEDRLEIYHAGVCQLTAERLLGIHHAQIDYRHMIESLVRKPGAFARYKYRDAFFPSFAFRRAYDALHQTLSDWEADVEYLRILHLAARTMESNVQAALELLLEEGVLPRLAKVEGLVTPARVALPALAPPQVDLKSYDGLLSELEEVA